MEQQENHSRIETLGGEDKNPSPLQIQSMTQEIQASWTKKIQEQRRWSATHVGTKPSKNPTNVEYFYQPTDSNDLLLKLEEGINGRW